MVTPTPREMPSPKGLHTREIEQAWEQAAATKLQGTRRALPEGEHACTPSYRHAATSSRVSTVSPHAAQHADSLSHARSRRVVCQCCSPPVHSRAARGHALMRSSSSPSRYFWKVRYRPIRTLSDSRAALRQSTAFQRCNPFTPVTQIARFPIMEGAHPPLTPRSPEPTDTSPTFPYESEHVW
jgi:hypothetical protein